MANEKKAQSRRKRPQEPDPTERKKQLEENSKQLMVRRGAHVADPKKVFTITNVVRRVQSRLRRCANPGRLRFKQYVGPFRLLRNQKLVFTEEQFHQYQSDVLKGLVSGALEMKDPEGWTYFVDADGSLLKRKGSEVQAMDEKQKPIQELKGEKPLPPPLPPIEEEEEEEEIDNDLDFEPYEDEEDDLTELPGVGPSRAEKLKEAGIKSFRQIADMLPVDLVGVLGSVTEDQAAEMCEEASRKGGLR